MTRPQTQSSTFFASESLISFFPIINHADHVHKVQRSRSNGSATSQIKRRPTGVNSLSGQAVKKRGLVGNELTNRREERHATRMKEGEANTRRGLGRWNEERMERLRQREVSRDVVALAGTHVQQVKVRYWMAGSIILRRLGEGKEKFHLGPAECCRASRARSKLTPGRTCCRAICLPTRFYGSKWF